MSNKEFVYPEIEAHKPYREITRETPLETHYGGDLTYRPKGVDPQIALDTLIRHSPLDNIKWLPTNPWERQAAIDNLFINENGGVNLCHCWTRIRGIREGGIRLSRHCSDYSGPTALEVLAWGVGVFRASKTEQDTSFMIATGGDPFPKVVSKHLRILRHHLIPTEDWGTDEEGEYTDESVTTVVRYESTNLILADSYGELEQLRNREMEKDFLGKYFDQLKRTAESEVMLQTYPPYSRAWTTHIKEGIWESPPESVEELSERVNFLLESTLVDNNPREEITDYTHHPSMFD